MISLGSSTWGTANPYLAVSFAYEKTRSGADMLYRVQVTVGTPDPYYFGYPIYLDVTIDGVKVVSKKTIKNASPNEWSSPYVYTSGWTTVANKISGTTSVVFRIYSGSGNNRDTSYSYSMAVDAAASTVSATSATVGGTSVWTIMSASSTYTHKLEYKLVVGQTEGNWTLVSNSVSGLAKYSFSLTGDVETAIYSMTASAQSATCFIRITTYDGQTQVGTPVDTASFTIYLSEAECAPTVVATAIDANNATTALTGDSSRWVRYLSEVHASMSVSAKHDASIVAKMIGGTSEPTGEKTITGIETDSVVFSATDSRGYTTSQTVTASALVPYIPVTFVPAFSRATPTGPTINVSFSGACYNGYFDAAEQHANALTITYRYRYSGGSWSNMQTLSSGNYHMSSGNAYYSGSSGDSPTVISLPDTFDYTKVYEIEMTVTDSAGSSATATRSVARGVPVFDWGQDDIQFHCDVDVEGDLNVDGDFTLAQPLPIAQGGTGAVDAATALVNLGLADHIVETGEDTTTQTNWKWTWIKFDSGLCFLFGNATAQQSVSITGSGGNLYYSAAIEKTLPFEIVGYKTVILQAQNATTFLTPSGPTTTKLIYRANKGQSGSTNVWASAFIVCAWK